MIVNANLEDLMYESGITAQGSWDQLDEYDRSAILRLVRLVVYRTAYLAAEGQNESGSGIDIALEHFGV